MSDIEPTKSVPTNNYGDAAPRVFDAISKSIAGLAVVIYVCGYLITSISDSRYGFSVMSPLRPRIVAAGVWYGFFIVAPLLLLQRVSKSSLASGDTWWWKACKVVYFYLFACIPLSWVADWVFQFDTIPSTPTPRWWVVLIWIIGIVAAIIFYALFRDRIPKYLIAIASLLFVSYVFYSGILELLSKGHFIPNALYLWLYAVGALGFLEMSVRSWQLKAGDWAQSFFYFGLTLVVFATTYYPHLKSSVGGGVPVPITIYFSKESATFQNQSVRAFLIDETDSGLYVLLNDDHRATFIPRDSVSLIHFSTDPTGFAHPQTK